MLLCSDTGSSVIADYKTPLEFKGNLKKVIIDASGEMVDVH
jgi:hypothetical protein